MIFFFPFQSYDKDYKKKKKKKSGLNKMIKEITLKKRGVLYGFSLPCNRVNTSKSVFAEIETQTPPWKTQKFLSNFQIIIIII